MLLNLPIADRQCGSCSACCTVMAVASLKKGNYDGCKHLAKNGQEQGPQVQLDSHGNSEGCCTIYTERPTACRNFECFWKLGIGIDGDERRRPDNLGIIFNRMDMAPDDPRWSPANNAYFTAWEVVPNALESQPVKYLLSKLVKRYTILVIRYGGTPTLLLDKDGYQVVEPAVKMEKYDECDAGG